MDKFELLIDIFDALDIKVNNRYEIEAIILKQDTLKSKSLIDELYRRVPNLKSFYNSSKLTCLHKNSLDKQKFPAVNMFRQLLKCNNFRMEPYVISKGYIKYSGKKIVERYYRLIDLCEHNADADTLLLTEPDVDDTLLLTEPDVYLDGFIE
jgi:hypothetical protein